MGAPHEQGSQGRRTTTVGRHVSMIPTRLFVKHQSYRSDQHRTAYREGQRLTWYAIKRPQKSHPPIITVSGMVKKTHMVFESFW